MRSPAVCVAALALMACTSTTTGYDLSATRELQANQSEWSHSDPHSYSYVYTIDVLARQVSVRITVVNDAVTSAVDAATGGPPELEFDWPTIDGIFAIARKGLEANAEGVDIAYDPQLRYPTELSVAGRYNNPGGSYHATITEFQALH